MVDQHTDGLDATLRKSGCLFLAYLWAGWLWRAARIIGGPALPGDEFGMVGGKRHVDSTGWVNAVFGAHVSAGDVAKDATIIRPGPIVRTGGDVPALQRVTIEEVYADEDKIQDRILGTLLDPAPGTKSFEAIIQHYTWGKHEHFVGSCRAPYGYYDPWIASACVQHGKLVGARVVTIGG